MAYSPRSDLLTPTVAPDTQGLGPGITAGMNNFSSLVQLGLANKRQDQRDTKIWEQTLIRDKAKFDNDYSMLDKRTAISDKRDAANKQDLSEFSVGIWEGIKSTQPDLIDPEINDKFYGANANTRNALALTKQKELAEAMKSQMEADRRAEQQKAANTWTRAPGTNNIINGLGSVLAINQTYGPAGAPPDQGTGPDMWKGQGPALEAPQIPGWLGNMTVPKTFANPKKTQATEASTGPPAPRSAGSYYQGGTIQY
jgi:hypothetical protein